MLYIYSYKILYFLCVCFYLCVQRVLSSVNIQELITVFEFPHLSMTTNQITPFQRYIITQLCMRACVRTCTLALLSEWRLLQACICVIHTCCSVPSTAGIVGDWCGHLTGREKEKRKYEFITVTMVTTHIVNTHSYIYIYSTQTDASRPELNLRFNDEFLHNTFNGWYWQRVNTEWCWCWKQQKVTSSAAFTVNWHLNTLIK